MQRITTIFLLFLFGQMTALQAQSDTLWVRANATGANDGSTWADAFTDLRDALAQSAAGDEIWVAQGTYRPDTLGGNLTSTFFIEKNIQLLGGFAGEGPQADERDPNAYLTILSGDLAGDDLFGDLDSNRTDNVRTVVTVGLAVNDSTLIDGFYLEGGHATGDDSQFQYRRGGGLFSFGSPRIQHIFFQNNFADAGGGALYFHTAGAEGAQVRDCFFTQNKASDGGAAMLFIAGGEGVTFENCEFVENLADDNGGALRVYNSNCLLDGCTFQFNFAERGGAIDVRSIFDDNETVLKNSLVTENAARQGGGVNFQTNSGLGASNNYLRIDTCDFIGNLAVQQDTSQQGGRQGGAIRIVIDRTTDDCGAVIKNTHIINSQSDGSGGAVFVSLEGQALEFVFENGEISLTETANEAALQIIARDVATGTATVENVLLAGNTSVEGSGALSITAQGSSDVDFRVADCFFTDNIGEFRGGAMQVLCLDTAQLDLLVEQCRFELNGSNAEGGAVALRVLTGGMRAQFRNCVFAANASTEGAAIAALPSALNSSELSLENCLFFENDQSQAVSTDSYWQLRMVNCTLADNNFGSLQFLHSTTAFLQNNLIASGGFPELVIVGTDAIVTSGGGNLVRDDSMDDLLGSTDQSTVDPAFAFDPDFPYQLEPTSPAIDAGVLPDDHWPTDLLGNDRLNGCIDAGAYESVVTVSNDCLSAAGEVSEGMKIQLFPNPTSGAMNVVLPAANVNETQLQVLDVHGRVLRSEPISGTETLLLDVSNLPSGVYLLKIGGAASRRFLVVRDS